MRALYRLHRWVGVSAGLMLFLWYGSGLYVHWRALPTVLTPDEQRRLAGEPFSLTDAKRDFRHILSSQPDESIKEVRLRRAASRLVYEVHRSAGHVTVF